MFICATGDLRGSTYSSEGVAGAHEPWTARVAGNTDRFSSNRQPFYKPHSVKIKLKKSRKHENLGYAVNRRKFIQIMAYLYNNLT